MGMVTGRGIDREGDGEVVGEEIGKKKFKAKLIGSR